MTELKTKVVLRNDSTANWSANETVVLLKGEVGIEFLADGTSKVKIGDGVKTWAELDYFGGEVLVGDDSTIVVDGQTISLTGFNEAEVGAHLVKGADGQLTWVVLNTESDEALQTTVATLQKDVDDINEILFPSEEGKLTLLSRVETLESEIDGVDKKISDSINAFAEKVSDDGTVNTLKELIDYVSEHGTETASIVADITELKDNVVKGIKVNGTLLDVVNGEVDITTPIITSSDEINKISIAEDGSMEVNSINVSKLVQNENEYLVLNGGSSSI